MIKSHVLYQLSYGPVTTQPSAKLQFFPELQTVREVLLTRGAFFLVAIGSRSCFPVASGSSRSERHQAGASCWGVAGVIPRCCMWEFH